MFPIERPGKIIGVGLNYRDHAEEQGTALPEAPLLFAKWQNALIGPGEPIVIPPIVTKCDYEAERQDEEVLYPELQRSGTFRSAVLPK